MVHFEEHFLYDGLAAQNLPHARPGDEATFEVLRGIVNTLREGSAGTEQTPADAARQ